MFSNTVIHVPLVNIKLKVNVNGRSIDDQFTVGLISGLPRSVDMLLGNDIWSTWHTSDDGVNNTVEDYSEEQSNTKVEISNEDGVQENRIVDSVGTRTEYSETAVVAEQEVIKSEDVDEKSSPQHADTEKIIEIPAECENLKPCSAVEDQAKDYVS